MLGLEQPCCAMGYPNRDLPQSPSPLPAWRLAIPLVALAACGYPPLEPLERVPDAQACFGAAPFTICLLSAPTMPLTISNTTFVDTTDSAMCTITLSGGINYCVIAATSISVEATLRAIGPKPLVLLASDTITVTANATVDVGSHSKAMPELGAGADPATCDAGTSPTTVPGGGGKLISGGGAGGSFLGLGGAGGNAGGVGVSAGMPGR